VLRFIPENVFIRALPYRNNLRTYSLIA